MPTSAAVTEICRRLDGIALAIELAAARMVSMSAQDVRDRLGDRFRLLSGSRRGLERHQTLRQHGAMVLRPARRRRADGVAALFGVRRRVRRGRRHRHLRTRLDEYAVLDVLDSLVRKSLITVERVGGHARYGMLETIRQFAEEQLAATEHDQRGPGSSRPLLRRAGRRPLGPVGRARLSRARLIGSTPSSPTCAPGSAGPPTTPTWSPPPRSPPTPP